MNLFLTEDIMFQALLEKDPQFEGQFFVAVKTTGIFCRPTCTARKPKRENVEFFEKTKEALANGYRPCKVCNPLRELGEIPEDIQGVLKEIESHPMDRITDYSLTQRGMDPNRIRRWFQRQHGITFQVYQRQMRINHAFRDIKNGDKVIEAAFDNGFGSLSGFGHSFKKATKVSPRESMERNVLTFTRLTTPLGPMIAVAAESGICLLEFADRKALESESKQIQSHFESPILPGTHPHLETLKEELASYFSGLITEFSVPLSPTGTPFQNRVWKALQEIPYGQTRSYLEQAMALGNAKAIRAVAQANGRNKIAIIIPCHRVIGSNGKLTGYGGGLWRKKWLIDHEMQFIGKARGTDPAIRKSGL